MAEDDDDEGFGDFKFASFPNQTVHSDQINGRNSTTTIDDVEWGDFVEYPLRSELSSGLSHTQSPSKPSEPSKPSDPFAFFSDHSTTPSQSVATRIESVLSRVESEKTQWMKPNGVLPLSIFGDVEEEEEQSGVVDLPVGDSKDSFADKRVGNAKNGSNIYLGFGIDDIIANLYSQSQQIKAENGSNSNLNGTNSNSDGVHLNVNGSISNLSGLNLNLNSNSVSGNKDFDIITNLFNQSQQSKAESGLNSNSNGFISNLTASTSNLSGLNLNINASTSNLTELNSNFNGLNSNSDLVGGDEEFDGDDDGWEFKDANSEWKIKDGSAKEHVESELLGLEVQSPVGQEIQAGIV